MNQNSNSRFMHIFILKIACFLILFSIQTFAQQTVNHSTVQPGAGLSDSYVNTQYFLQIQPEANEGFIINENVVDDDFNCGNCSGFKTYTQGGWGAKASGNNPGMYLKNNFAGAFPSGVTIGSSLGYTIKFTSYQSIDDFLPSGSSSVSLTKNYTNPGSSYKNVLAGQLLAATLNVKFDYYDPNFGNNSIHLGDLIIASGTFSGWTVNNLLVLANNALGGSSSGYSLSDINNALDQINNNYDNGTTNNNFLNCPAICTLTLTGAKTDALCNGASNGSITLTATGGSGTVRYLWNDGYISQNRTGLAAGTYSVTATDNANCTATFSATISQPAALSVTGTATNATTNKGSNGSIQLTASGGTFPYTYSWNDGNNSKDRSGLKAGNYTVTVTDAKGCTASKQFVITEPSCNLSIASQVTNVSCFGGNNGSINLTITGSNGGTTFLWNNGTTTEDRSSLAAGNYSVTVTDNANCTAAYSTVITQPTALTLTGIATNVSVFHGNNGGIQLTTSGGTAPYTYTWNDGSHAKDRTALQAGNFSVTVTDAKGCTTSKQFAIAEPLCNLGVTSQLTNVSCFGGNNGSIILNVTGANGSTSFLWNNGSTAKDRSGVPAGTYSVTVTDDANCVALHSATITQPSALSITGTAGNVTTVHGSNGSIQITVTGGTSPYTYSWNDGSTAKDRSALQAGTFTVTATDAKGCTVSKQFTIDEPVCNLTVTSQVNNASCFGAQDGSINLSVTGANGNSTFLWNNGSAIKDRTGLAAGTYSVTVTDNANCIAIYSTAVSQPLPLTITGTTSDVTLVNGNNGSIQIVPSGGTAPYTYLWNDGSVIKNRTALHAGNYSVTVTDAHGCSTAKQFTIAEPVCNLSALSFTNNVSCSGAQDGSIHLTVSGANGTPQFIWSNGAVTENNNGLSAGAYSVTVTDEANCTATYSMNIIQPSALSITGTAANVTTVHGNNGNIHLTISGGTAPYTYSWNDGSTAKDRNSLQSGNFTVTVTDAHGCSLTKQFTITEPVCNLSVSAQSANISCAGVQDGGIILTATGANGNAQFLWNDGATIKDRTGLQEGAYSVTVTDDAGCTADYSTSITQPSPLSITGTASDVTTVNAANGSIALSISGGTEPYAYSWSDGSSDASRSGLNAGDFSVTVTDAHGCNLQQQFTINEPVCNLSVASEFNNVSNYDAQDGNIDITVTGANGTVAYLWNNGDTSEDRSNLAPGIYSVTVTDAANCTDNKTFSIKRPDILGVGGTVANVTAGNVTDGSIALAVTGGTAPYSYEWSDGNTDANRSGLAPGTYRVRVRDSHGNSFDAEFTVIGPCNLTISSEYSDASYFGAADGSINLTVTGGNGALSYLWNDGSTDEDRTDLSSGVYSVTVTDISNCTLQDSFTVSQPDTLIVDGNVSDVTSSEQDNGSIELSITGGGAPYTYLWNDGSTDANRYYLPAGTYGVTVTDSYGRKFNKEFTVAGLPCTLAVTGATVNATCLGINDGSIELTATGAIGPVSALWSDGSTLRNRYNLSPTNYDVTVTDAYGCSVSKSFSIEESDGVTISSNTTDVSIYQGSNGSIDITVTGGAAPYTYSWGDGSSDVSRTGLISGSYDLLITDTRGCTAHQEFLISEPVCNLSISGEVTNTSIFQASDGSIDLTATGATGAVSYLWGDGGTTEDVFNLAAGRYFVTATDEANCVAYTSFTVKEPEQLSISGKANAVSVVGASDGTINITVTGGTAPYTYLWSDGNTDEDREDLAIGIYSVIVTDARGGVVTTSYLVTDPTNKLTNGGSSSAVANEGSPAFTAKVSPNPTSGLVQLTVTAANPAEATIRIYNSKGTLVKQMPFSIYSGVNSKEINLSSFAKGMYQVQVVNGDETKSIKILVQ